MTDTMLILEVIKNSGLKKKKIAEIMGISYASLKKKIDNERAFNAEEIVLFCKAVNINDRDLRERIFFEKDVDK